VTPQDARQLAVIASGVPAGEANVSELQGRARAFADAMLGANGSGRAAALEHALKGEPDAAEIRAAIFAASPSANGRDEDNDWPEPDPINEAPPAPRLPLDLIPQELADVAADVSERQQSPVDYAAWSLVVSMAGLIGRGAAIRPRAYDDWSERPALWVAHIGPPSSLKSPSQEEGARPLRRQQERDHEVYVRAMEQWRADCADAKQADPKNPNLPPQPTERRCWTADATVEKLAMLCVPDVSRGLSVVRDELAGVILDMEKYHPRGGDRQFFLQAYTGGPYTVDRVTRESLFVPDLLINMMGGIQPDVARSIFGGGPDDGFGARVLSIWPDPPSTWHRVDRWPNKVARHALDAVSDRLGAADWRDYLVVDEFKPTPHCRLAPEGQTLFDRWHEELMTALRTGAYSGRFEGRVGKYPGLAARLMLVCHLVEWAAGRAAEPAIVPATTVANVLELMDDYVLPMERRVYSAYAIPADAEGGRRIARWLESTGPTPAQFSAREIRRHDWAGLEDQASVTAALEWLVSRRWLREAEPEKRPGRPSAVYLVNPRLGATNG
jgi:hypothetical protein